MQPGAAQSLLVSKPDPLGPFLLGSMLLHAAALGAVLGLSYLRLPPPIDLNQKPITATLVRLGKPRDPNLLPIKQEAPPPPQKLPGTEPVAEQPKPSDSAIPIPVPGVKATSPTPKQEGEKNSDAQRRKQLFSAFNKTSKRDQLTELDGLPTGDVRGDSSTAEGEAYWGLLSAQIRRNYDVAETIPEQDRLHLRAQVILFIGRAGEVLRVQLAQSSGNSLFDGAVLAAAKKAAPYSPPPEHLRALLQKSGVRLEFRP